MMNEVVNLEGTSLAEQKEYNKKLFQLFNNMINPLSELEGLYMLRRNVQDEIEQLNRSNIRGWILGATLLVGFFLGNEVYGLFVKIPLLGNLIRTMGMLFIILFACGIWLAVSAIDKKFRDKKILEKNEYLEKVNLQIQDFTNELRERIQFIPPSYCYSDALRYFVRAYMDGKVDNVKEAMNSYDEYMHRMNMEQGQHMIMRQQGQILANQVALQEQMSFDTAMIILSNFAFR